MGRPRVETMKALGVYDALKPKIVQGNSIAQAFQFVDTRNAEVGFVALSQLHGVTEGTRWEVPENLHAPIRQDAVLLKTGANSEASKAFLAFLKGPEATRDHRAVRLRSRVSAAMPGLPPDIWVPIKLTIELATIIDALAARCRDAARLVACAFEGLVQGGRSPRSSRCRWCCRRPCSASIC